MMQRDKAPHDTGEEQTLFYLIFNQVAKDAPFPDISMEEIEEIDQVRRMVVDVADDPPRFMTST